MIFIDRSVPKGVANALKAVRNDVMWLEDQFPHGTRDVEWLEAAGRNGWLVITRDKMIRRRHGERQAIADHNVGCFCLVQSKDPTRWEYLKLLVTTLDEMERVFAETPRPFLFGVDRQGQFRQLELPAPSHAER